MQRKIRVLVGKPGLDGHDRGAKVVAAALRDAGMEVIYTGLHQTPEQVVEAAVQEDVDVVALSILSGAHMTLFPEVLELMRSRGIADRLLTGGGIIPAEDMESLAKMGVGRLFGPGASTQDIALYIREWFLAKHGADSLPPPPPPRELPASFEASAPPRHPPAHRAARPKSRSGAKRDAKARPRAAAKRAVSKRAAKPKRGAGARPSRSRSARKRR